MSIIANIAARAAAIPCPQWVSDALDAHDRRRALVLQIWMLSDEPTAMAALWLARASWLRGGTVEGSLRAFKEALLR